MWFSTSSSPISPVAATLSANCVDKATGTPKHRSRANRSKATPASSSLCKSLSESFSNSSLRNQRLDSLRVATSARMSSKRCSAIWPRVSRRFNTMSQSLSRVWPPVVESVLLMMSRTRPDTKLASSRPVSRASPGRGLRQFNTRSELDHDFGGKLVAALLYGVKHRHSVDLKSCVQYGVLDARPRLGIGVVVAE